MKYLLNLFIFRLSQAHCRLMNRTTILPMDAVTAVSLVDLSMQDCTLDDTVDALHSTFQKYPDFDYLCTAKKLLTRLNLHEIWQNELLFYGKLLQVDSKTLEADIESENPRLFAKYDDVSDDTMQLSASLVTSSYFKKVAMDKENVQEENGKNAVKERLAATLKKHKNLNRADKKPPAAKKRKRKEVTIDSSKVKSKIRKKSKNDDESSSDDGDDDEFIEDQNILNAVPSVNDVFVGLGIDFNFETEGSGSENTIDNGENNSEEITVKDNDITVDSSKPDTTRISNDLRPSTSASKLKQFLCVKNCDVEKYEERKKLMKQPDKLKSRENSLSSLKSSQISIFESSDCDIDLEL